MSNSCGISGRLLTLLHFWTANQVVIDIAIPVAIIVIAIVVIIVIVTVQLLDNYFHFTKNQQKTVFESEG